MKYHIHFKLHYPILQNHKYSYKNYIPRSFHSSRNHLSEKDVVIFFPSYLPLFRLDSFFLKKKKIFIFKDLGNNFFLLSFKKLFDRFRIPQKIQPLIWNSFFKFFYNYDFCFFEKSLVYVFDSIRLDNHGMLFKFIVKFFNYFPYHNPNSLFFRLKIKGKMSRRGIARTKTIFLKKHFFRKEKVFLFKKYYFLIIAKTGCTCFLCSVSHSV